MFSLVKVLPMSLLPNVASPQNKVLQKRNGSVQAAKAYEILLLLRLKKLSVT
jgi:hypothetical protein